jgi:hypothetical protein
MRQLFIALFMSLAINAIASDYVIIRAGEEVRVYEINVSSNGTTYLTIYPLKNPSVDMLRNMNLPKELWGQMEGVDGIYDTRLVEANNQLMLANQLVDGDREYIQELRDRAEWFKLWLIAVSVISALVIFIMTMNMKGHKR